MFLDINSKKKAFKNVHAFPTLRGYSGSKKGVSSLAPGACYI